MSHQPQRPGPDKPKPEPMLPKAGTSAVRPEPKEKEMGIYSGGTNLPKTWPSMNPGDRGDRLLKAGTSAVRKRPHPGWWKDILDGEKTAIHHLIIEVEEKDEIIKHLRSRLKAISNQRAKFRDEIRPKPLPTARQIAAQILFFFGGLVTGLAAFVLWWPS